MLWYLFSLFLFFFFTMFPQPSVRFNLVLCQKVLTQGETSFMQNTGCFLHPHKKVLDFCTGITFLCATVSNRKKMLNLAGGFPVTFFIDRFFKNMVSNILIFNKWQLILQGAQRLFVLCSLIQDFMCEATF